MSVRVIDRTNSFIARQNAAINAALRVVAEDVPQQAKPFTPRRTGDLRRNVSIRMLSKRATITWEMEYAAAQNAGRTQGRRMTNYTTAGTGKGFAKKGVDRATAKWDRILKQAMSSLRS